MKNYWKISTIILAFISAGLCYSLYQEKTRHLKINQMSLNEFDSESYDVLKKKDPTTATDLNDYFYKNQTKINFTKDLYDFDTIKEGEVIKRSIEFINEGAQPFFITDLKVSCGCTIASYAKEPIPPGKMGIVNIEFNSTGKNGFSMNKLTLIGNVEKKEKSAYFKVYVQNRK